MALISVLFAGSCQIEPASEAPHIPVSYLAVSAETETMLDIPTESVNVASGPHACPQLLGSPVDGGWDQSVPALPDSPLISPDATPGRIHLGYGANASHELVFTWETHVGVVATRVEIGEVAGEPLWAVPGASFELSGKRIHVVRVCGLEAGRTWFYRVGGGGEFSPEASVATAPDENTTETVRFAVAGDSRGAPATWGLVAAAAQAAGAEFLVFTGDALSNGSVMADWETWFDAAAGPLTTMPLVLVQGNHEANDQFVYGLFPTPNDQGSFGLDYGPVHFSVVNDNAYGEWTAAGMAEWLGADLAATDLPWRVPVFHRPIVSSSNPHGEDATNKTYLLPVIDAAGVPLVFSGHAHNYERSHPVRGMVEAEGGTVYFVTGGAGAPLYPASYGRAYTAVEAKIEHWLLVDANATTWTSTTFDLAGNVIDFVVFTR